MLRNMVGRDLVTGLGVAAAILLLSASMSAGLGAVQRDPMDTALAGVLKTGDCFSSADFDSSGEGLGINLAVAPSHGWVVPQAAFAGTADQAAAAFSGTLIAASAKVAAVLRNSESGPTVLQLTRLATPGEDVWLYSGFAKPVACD